MYYLLLFADWHETWGRTKQTIPLPLEYGTWHRRLGYEATFIALAICLSCSGSHRRILSEARGCIASPIFCVWILVCRRRDEWFTCCRKTRRRNGSYRQTAAPEDWAPDDDRQLLRTELQMMIGRLQLLRTELQMMIGRMQLLRTELQMMSEPAECWFLHRSRLPRRPSLASLFLRASQLGSLGLEPLRGRGGSIDGRWERSPPPPKMVKCHPFH